MGGKSEARERQQKAGGGGSAVASAAAVIPLLRGSEAGGCAKGRSVERRGRRERECLGSTATAAAACQDERGREGGRGKEEKAAGLPERRFFFLYCFASGERIVKIDKEAYFSPLLMIF